MGLLLLIAQGFAQGTAARFDGNDWIALAGVTPGPSYTVEAWVRLENDGLRTVIGAADQNDHSAFLIQYRSGTWAVQISDDDPIEEDTCSDNQPHICHPQPYGFPVDVHVAVAVNPSQMRLFLNGVEVASSPTGIQTDFAGTTWFLGGDAENGGVSEDFLEGVIDEVRLWSGIRSQSELLCARDVSLTGQETNLFAYWALDADVGGVVEDGTGGGGDGLWQTATRVASPFGLLPANSSSQTCTDADGDGFPAVVDCDDNDPAETLDSDGDGICDGVDICPLGDDGLDADQDTVPDACDLCPGVDDRPDADADEVPDCADVCPGADDREDADGDGIPDGCDGDTDVPSDTDSDADTDTDADADTDTDTDTDTDVEGTDDYTPDEIGGLPSRFEGDFVGGTCSCDGGVEPQISVWFFPWVMRR